MKLNKKSKTKLLIAIFLIIFGTVGRIILKDMPNIETITVSALLAGSLLGGFYTLFVPLMIIALSDMYIGNDPILLFTWSAWGIAGFFGWLIRKRKGYNYKFVLSLTGMGMLFAIFFYLYTNFGVWLLWQMYPKNLAGLLQCYIAGLPFFRNSIISNLVFIPAMSALLLLALKFKIYKYPDKIYNKKEISK